MRRVPQLIRFRLLGGMHIAIGMAVAGVAGYDWVTTVVFDIEDYRSPRYKLASLQNQEALALLGRLPLYGSVFSSKTEMRPVR